MKTPSTVAASAVVAKGSTSSNYRNYLVRRATLASLVEFRAGNGAIGLAQTSALWSATDWEHRAVVVSPGTNLNTVKVQFYTNGVPGVPVDNLSPVPTNSDATGLYLGRNGGTGALFNGAIDDLRIYNRSLSGSEVKNLYEAFK